MEFAYYHKVVVVLQVALKQVRAVTQIGVLKSKIEKNADNVLAKLADLPCGLNIFKENKAFSIII